MLWLRYASKLKMYVRFTTPNICLIILVCCWDFYCVHTLGILSSAKLAVAAISLAEYDSYYWKINNHRVCENVPWKWWQIVSLVPIELIHKEYAVLGSAGIFSFFEAFNFIGYDIVLFQHKYCKGYDVYNNVYLFSAPFFQVLKFFNAPLGEYKCIFTSGATGALKLVGECFPWTRMSNFWYTMENHNSVLGIREYPLLRSCS